MNHFLEIIHKPRMQISLLDEMYAWGFVVATIACLVAGWYLGSVIVGKIKRGKT